MAKRGMSGQINMFDFFSGGSMDGEVEMVSLFPGDGSFEDISEGSDELASGIQEIKDEPEPEPVVEAVPEIKPEPVVEAKPEPKPAVAKKTVAKPKAKPEPVKEVEPVPEPEVVEEKPQPKAKVVKKVAVNDASAPIMHKEVLDAKGHIIAQIAFRNYNRVSLQLPGEEMREYQFDSSKEAVDFYIGELWKLGSEES